MTINCAGLPDRLLEQELFGYEKTGYNETAHAGKIELAHGGALFLDEIEFVPRHAGKIARRR